MGDLSQAASAVHQAVSRDFLAQKLNMADSHWVFAAVILVILVTFPNKDAVVGLDNGLALTPPSTVTQFNL